MSDKSARIVVRACSARVKLNREVAGYADILATILARKSVRMSVSVSVSVSVPWNSSFIQRAAGVGMQVDITACLGCEFDSLTRCQNEFIFVARQKTECRKSCLLCTCCYVQY